LILEHGIYTAALAIIVAMVYELYTKKNNSFLIASVIWFSMCIPDTDYLFGVLVTAISGSSHIFEHGDFHNVFCLVLFTVIGGWWVYRNYADISMNLAMACVFIGFLSHMFEDALVYEYAYAFFAPFTMDITPTGWLGMSAPRDVMAFGISLGATKVYAVGFALLACAIVIRYTVQGSDWLYRYSEEFKFARLCEKLGIQINTRRNNNNDDNNNGNNRAIVGSLITKIKYLFIG
jgi:membrane-bound metal-dependent hydrolase YbcI (DUF457 family)